MASSPTKGELFECRVARLLAAEGALVRRRVNLDSHFGERFTITDLDVLAFYFSPTLEVRKVIGECKATETKGAPSAGDRLLWSAGLGKLVGADLTFIAVAKRARGSERKVASLVGSGIMDIRDIERREEVLGLSTGDPYGSHDPALGALRDEAKRASRGDEELRRLERFVTSELWLAAPFPALKKALGAARTLGKHWSPSLPDGARRTVEWMASEAVVGAILALVRVAGFGYRQPEDVLAQAMHERLSQGLADYQSLREISRQVDKVFATMLPKLGVDPARSVEAMGLFEPQPPSYAEPLTELVERLARQPQAASKMVQLADCRYAEFLGASDSPEARLGSVAEPERLNRLVASFLEGQFGVPEALLRPLRSVGNHTALNLLEEPSRKAP